MVRRIKFKITNIRPEYDTICKVEKALKFKRSYNPVTHGDAKGDPNNPQYNVQDGEVTRIRAKFVIKIKLDRCLEDQHHYVE